VFIVDANILLNAVSRRAPRHKESLRWLDEALAATETVGFPWMTLAAFLRIATSPAILPKPLTPDEALEVVEAWTSAPSGTVVEATPGHFDVLAELIRSTGARGNLMNDAHLAALAVEYEATIVTFDTDFDLFGVPWHRPGRAA
jgi:hypothetical protein